MNRVLCTYDADFVALAATGTEHAGIVFGQADIHYIGAWVRFLELMHAVYTLMKCTIGSNIYNVVPTSCPRVCYNITSISVAAASSISADNGNNGGRTAQRGKPWRRASRALIKAGAGA